MPCPALPCCALLAAVIQSLTKSVGPPANMSCSGDTSCTFQFSGLPASRFDSTCQAGECLTAAVPGEWGLPRLTPHLRLCMLLLCVLAGMRGFAVPFLPTVLSLHATFCHLPPFLELQG